MFTTTRRRSGKATAVALILLLIVLIPALFVAGWLLSSWLLMLTAGIVHRDWIPALPLLGWKGSLPIAFMFTAFGFIGGMAKAVGSKRSS
jgi:hypothetical protein